MRWRTLKKLRMPRKLQVATTNCPVPLPRGERLGEGATEHGQPEVARAQGGRHSSAKPGAREIPPLAPPFKGGGLSDRTRLALRMLFILALIAFLQCPTFASGGGGHGAAEGGHGGGHGAEPAPLPPHDPKLPRAIDLGEFDLRNFRPTHNEIASLKFAVHVVLPPGTTDDTVREFEHWKRRLRDQAITAIRSATPDDLADPKLKRVHRLFYLRLKRVPTPQEISDVYVTDFAMSSG